MDVLIIYAFCTFGGVERILLNRAEAFKEYGVKVKLNIQYLYDSGALQSFQKYITSNKMDNFVSASVLADDKISNLENYDLVFVIDTPKILGKIQFVKNLFIECHTGYESNRKYLCNLPNNVRGIIVPSKSFYSLITNEFINLPPTYILPNFVSNNFFNYESSSIMQYFSKHPLTYFARIDELKNFDEAKQIFSMYENVDEIMYVIIGHGADEKATVQSLEKKNLLGKALIRNSIGFDQAPYMVDLIKQHRGIFISPSKSEAFGLSAAEFISGGVPVLLSDISAHRALVENDEQFLYQLGKLDSAKQKLDNILQNWEIFSGKIKKYSRKFRAKYFIEAWDELIKKL